MLIDSTYFTNKRNLPQTGNTEGLADVDAFIEEYEPQYLQCVLGYNLWQLFDAATSGSGLPAEDRYLALLNGGTFTQNGCTYRWPGFMARPSPIAYFVYYQYVDNKVTDFALTGMVVSETDNNRRVASVDRLVDSWNRMCDLNNLLKGYMTANASIYPEWQICNYPGHCECGCSCHDEPPGCDDLFKKINSLGL